VRIVSLDPAHNLGDIFGVTLKKKTAFTRQLSLEELDLKKRTQAYLKQEIGTLNETYKYLQVLNLDKYFSVLQYSPGIEEYALLSGIEEIIKSDTRSDYLIFDTPPTGLTLRFLALPRITITWIDRLIQIRRTILEKCHTIHRLCGDLSQEETLLKYDEEDDRVLQRLFALHRNYHDLDQLLQGERCRISVVFNPDLLSLRETERLIRALGDLNLPLSLLIDNKITEANQAVADRVEDRLRQLTRTSQKRVLLANGGPNGQERKLYEIDEDLVSWFPATPS
jgi:arsenite-transporting ATPase